MEANAGRIRFTLYTVVLVALITSAVVALVTIGGDKSNAADPPRSVAQRPTSTQPTATSPADTSPVDTGRASTSAPAGTSAASTATPTTPASKPVSARAKAEPKVYVVKRGDTLSAIAAWFDVRGYEPLYDWNKTVIGRNPDLIFPGQKIIVDPGGAVSVSKP